LSEGITALGKEAIHYAVLEGRVQKEGTHEKEENLFGNALPHDLKVVYVYTMGIDKRCANFDPRSSNFLHDLCRTFDKNEELRKFVHQAGYSSSIDMMFNPDSDYTLSRAAAAEIWTEKGVQGIKAPSAQNSLLGDEGNIILGSEFPKDERVGSLIPEQKVTITKNASIAGADNIIITDLHPITGMPTEKKTQ
jgi:hypothetical protein